MQLFATLLVSSITLAAGSFQHCSAPGKSPQWNETACDQAASTCCPYPWSADSFGCCPLKNAVCCNPYNCCPEGSRCLASGKNWFDLVKCELPSGDTVLATGICKNGPTEPMSTSKPNLLILGDSVSIGYTPALASALADIAFVQHSPYMVDGGASDTLYGLQCNSRFFSSPSGIPFVPDFLYFNYGLHDYGNASLPGQAGPASDYAPQLAKLTRIYVNMMSAVHGAGAVRRIMFGLTSPMICNATDDAVILRLNKEAKAIMDGHGIATVDLHQPIVDKCGPVPQPTCMGHKGCWCPHCPAGYSWFAQTVLETPLRHLVTASL